MNILEVLHKTANLYPQKPALVFKEETVSFSQLHDRVLKFANGLKKEGVAKGDKVAIYLPNCPDYVYSYLAVFGLGAVGVPLDYVLKADELISCLGHSEAKLLIARPNQEVDLTVVQKAVPSLKKIVGGGEASGGGRLLEDILRTESPQPISPAIAGSDPALIMYTSGTTGKPKGILLTYKHFDGSPMAMKHFVDLSERDVKLCALPLSHIGGFIYIQNMIHYATTLILMDRFNPFEFLGLIDRFKVTCFHIVPPMYTAILTLKQIEKFDLSSLRWMVVFGAPSSPEILERFHRYCPNARLLNGWGMTETCPPNTVTPMDSDKISSVGKPAPTCEIKIFNEHDREVGIGEIGEIVIRGWVVMAGYYKDPDSTAELMRNGWFHTGDLGRFDAEGFLYIVGRKKEMIKVGGQIVYAPEVESALYKHEAVAEAAVIGIPDALRGEAVKAFVVLKELASVSVEDLRYFAREHLAHFKVPHSIELRQSLPKNRTGKIDKELLKQETIILK